MKSFTDKSFRCSMTDSNQEIGIYKNYQSDWVTIRLTINGNQKNEITLHGEDSVKCLRLLLTQLIENQ